MKIDIEYKQAIYVFIIVACSFIISFETLFLALPSPHLDLIHITQDVPAYYGYMEDDDGWRMIPMTLKRNSLCVVRRSIFIPSFDDAIRGRYIEMATSDSTIVYYKLGRSRTSDQPFIEGFDIVRFDPPFPW